VSDDRSPTDHRAFQELLGVYALDAVDPETAAMVERHLAECVRCSIEVAQHHEVAGLLANSGGESPAELWDGIATRLNTSAPPSWDRLVSRLEPGAGRADRLVDPDESDGGPAAAVVPLSAGRRRRWLQRGAALVAAAAVVAAVVLGVQVAHLHHQVSALQTRPLLSAAEQSALGRPSTRQVQLTASAGSSEPGRVTVVLTASGTGFVEVHRLPVLATGRTYQLWGVIGGTTISLGLLGPDPSVVPFSVAGGRSVQAFAITAEHAGGVVQSTNPPVVAGEVRA